MSLKKNERSLTTSQTSKTRLVTKVRFIIEKQNSLLKNKKALDNIRNTQVGHIMIDYRICCAMLNFNMKPCIPDGKHTVEVSKKILKKCKEKINKLESLLEMKFTSTVKSIQISNIDDFPQLKQSQIRRKITLGSYKLKQSQSYIGQIMEHGEAYFLQPKQIEKHVLHSVVLKDLENSKILAVLIPSRHKRGKKSKGLDEVNPKNFNIYYKVFIQYVPYSKSQSEMMNFKPHYNIKSIFLNNLYTVYNINNI